MASLSSKVAVFFGSVDKRSAGWYWTDASASQKRMAASTGPFETKEQALNDAAQSMAARRAPNDQPAMRGRSSVPSSKIIVRRAFLPQSRTPGRRLEFWKRVRAECSTLLALKIQGEALPGGSVLIYPTRIAVEVASADHAPAPYQAR
jgi:hypothetical protein